MHCKQPRLLGHVGESAITIVAQQRARNAPLFLKPAATLDPNIQETIIVVVGLLHVQTAWQSLQPSFSNAFDETTLAIVVKISNLAIQVHRGHDQINETVVVEIIQNATAGPPFNVEA